MRTAVPGCVHNPVTEPEALIREARRRQRRRWLFTVAVTAALVAGGAAVIAGSSGGSRPRPPAHHGLPAAADHGLPAESAPAPTLVTVRQASLPEGNSLSLTAGYGAVWVTGIGVTYQVNESTGEIARTISTPGTFPDGCGSGVAAGAGAVWVTHGCRGIYRINPQTGQVTASFPVPDAGDAIAVANRLVWVATYRGDLLRIRPGNGKTVGKPIPVGFGQWTIVPAAGALWVTSYGSGVYGGTVSRVDVMTGAVMPFGNLDVEAAGAGSLWTPQVQRIDPATGSVTASATVPGTSGWNVTGSSQVVFWKGSAWVLTIQRSLAFARIDPATDHVTGKLVPVGRPLPGPATNWPTAAAAGPTGLWVVDFSRNLLFHVATKPAT